MAKLDEIYSRELIGDISKGRYSRDKVDGMLRSLYEMGYSEGREWAERNLIEFMLLQMAQELHYEFGFGKKRLNRFYDEMAAALEGYAAGAYNMEDMRQALKDDAKWEIPFSFGD